MSKRMFFVQLNWNCVLGFDKACILYFHNRVQRLHNVLFAQRPKEKCNHHRKKINNYLCNLLQPSSKSTKTPLCSKSPQTRLPVASWLPLPPSDVSNCSSWGVDQPFVFISVLRSDTFGDTGDKGDRWCRWGPTRVCRGHWLRRFMNWRRRRYFVATISGPPRWQRYCSWAATPACVWL